jgi:hypothetical protein
MLGYPIDLVGYNVCDRKIVPSPPGGSCARLQSCHLPLLDPAGMLAAPS